MSDSPKFSEVDMTAGSMLREVARLHLQVQRETVACCEGTTLTQCTILTDLGRNGASTLIELARRIGFDKSWTSRAVDALVSMGLVEKTASLLDRRTIQITLSQAGLDRYTRLNQALNNQAAQVLNLLPQGERAQVYQALNLLHTALQTQAKALQDTSCAVEDY